MTVDVMLLGTTASALIAVLTLGILARRLIVGSIQKELESIRAELKPNSGSSLRDAVDSISDRQTTIGREIRDLKTETAAMRSRLDEHIQYHLEKE